MPANPFDEEEDPLAPTYQQKPPLAGQTTHTTDPFSPDLPSLQPSFGGAAREATPTEPQQQDGQGVQSPTLPTGGGSAINPTTGTLMGDPMQSLGGGTGRFDESAGGASAPLAGGPQYSDLVSTIQSAQNPQAAAGAQDQLARTLYADLTAAGHTVKWDGDTLLVDGRPYVLAGPGQAQPPQAFTPSAPTYTPTSVDPLTNFNPTAGTEGIDAATRDAITRLLANPSGVNPDVLKAKSREEAAALAQQSDEDLLRFGFQGGIDDSRWLASERASNLRGRDEAVIRSNRDIDIQTGGQQAADTRAAIATSQSYQALRADNAFRTAALQGDRIALDNALQQRATELGLSADNLRLDYTMGLMNDLTQRFGITTNAQLTREQLAQAGSQFQQDLIFRLNQLEQADAQFAAEYGLEAARFKAAEDQRGWDNSFQLTGGNK